LARILDEMKLREHDSSGEFRAVAEPLYRRDPVTNTIELTLLRANSFDDDALLLTIWERGSAVGAALQTPPYPLACNGIPGTAHPVVATHLARIRPELNGVRGSRAQALAFAAAWREVTGRGHTVTTEERLYRLAALRPPAGVRGAPRETTDSDHDWLAEWVEQFFIETFNDPSDAAAGRRFIDTAIAVGDRFVLWRDRGQPVSTAMLRAPSGGVSRIGPVFTPPDSRGHGYGSAVTAAAADLALRGGVDDVVLFADLANPTSNAIYRRIGFEAVTDSVRVGFDGLR
jgi:RimJ/RimL family protein N-acetyltransferase